MAKPIDLLTEEDLNEFPIWEFASNEEHIEGQDETWVRPLIATSIPMGHYALNCSADFLSRSGRRFCGIVGIDTTGEAKINHAALITPHGYIILPKAEFKFSKMAYTTAAEKIGIPLHELFPISFSVRCNIEGSVSPIRGHYGE